MRERKQRPLAEIADLLRCELVGDPHHLIGDVADLRIARSDELSFCANQKYYRELSQSRAGAVIIAKVTKETKGKNWLITSDPSQAFQRAIALFRKALTSGFHGIHASAVIHPSARLEADVQIGPHCTIDRDVTIGARSTLMAGVYVGAGSTLGVNCKIYPNAVIREDCHLGHQAVVQPGAVIGSCGYGFTTTSEGHIKQEQVGGVEIGDDVEIGALTAIDRGRFTFTRIGDGTKIDNLVQIAHGSQVGRWNLIVAQTGLAGSCSTGDWVTLAGQVAVAGHVHLAGGVTLAGRSGVTKDIRQPGIYAGLPAVPIREWRRQVVHFKKFAQKSDLR